MGNPPGVVMRRNRYGGRKLFPGQMSVVMFERKNKGVKCPGRVHCEKLFVLAIRIMTVKICSGHSLTRSRILPVLQTLLQSQVSFFKLFFIWSQNVTKNYFNRNNWKPELTSCFSVQERAENVVAKHYLNFFFAEMLWVSGQWNVGIAWVAPENRSDLPLEIFYLMWPCKISCPVNSGKCWFDVVVFK